MAVKKDNLDVYFARDLTTVDEHAWRPAKEL